MLSRRKIKGFTLVEVVVALGVFAIASTASLGIFVRSNQVQKRTANAQRQISDARYALEVMAREVRMGQVDYNYSGYDSPLPFLQNVLAVRDVDDQPVRFRRFEVETGRYVIQVCGLATCGVNDWLDITPEDLSIERLDFYISPSQDPFVWDAGLVDYPSDQQPLVTIVLETVGTYQEGEVNKITNFQTTVASRKYSR